MTPWQNISWTNVCTGTVKETRWTNTQKIILSGHGVETFFYLLLFSVYIYCSKELFLFFVLRGWLMLQLISFIFFYLRLWHGLHNFYSITIDLSFLSWILLSNFCQLMISLLLSKFHVHVFLHLDYLHFF